MLLKTILFDAGDILYNNPNRKSSVIKFLTERGYAVPVENDPIEKAKRRDAHAGKIETEHTDQSQVFQETLPSSAR